MCPGRVESDERDLLTDLFDEERREAWTLLHPSLIL